MKMVEAPPQNSPEPKPQQIKATVVGFSPKSCKHCLGRGFIGYERGFQEGRVIPCRCVTFFEVERLQRSWSEAQERSKLEESNARESQ